MSAEGKKIAIGVFCADWRLHQEGVHINNLLKNHLGVDVVDVLATAGPEGVALVPERSGEKEALANNLRVLIGAHKPVTIAFVGHEQCAGYPATNEEHAKDVKKLVEEYQKILDFGGELVGLVATYNNDSDWGLKEVVRI